MTTLILASAISSALVAGVFYAFSSFVMGALARLDSREGIAAMQSINVVVINPWFFAAFFGAGALAAVTSVLAVTSGHPSAALLHGAAALYLLGCLGVTIGGNVPLNDRLAAVDRDDPAAADVWRHYVRVWTRWNHVRTAASLAAGVLYALVLTGV